MQAMGRGLGVTAVGREAESDLRAKENHFAAGRETRTNPGR